MANFDGDITIFFSNLPETLQILELTDVYYGYQLMKPVLTDIPHLLELVLNDCPSSVNSMAVSMIGRPVAGLIEGSTGSRAAVDPNRLGGPAVLPRLRKLTISSYMDIKLEMIIEMLEALGGAKAMEEGEHFHFEGPPPFDYMWSQGDLARLKRLAKSGFEFDIVLGPRYLDYLSLLC